MLQKVNRRIGDIDFRFELEKGISSDGSHLKGLIVSGGEDNVLLNAVTEICQESGGGFYKVYIRILPDKGDVMEGAALSLMDEFCNHLKSLFPRVQYREMTRNMGMSGIGDAVDAVEFWFWLFQPT